MKEIISYFREPENLFLQSLLNKMKDKYYFLNLINYEFVKGSEVEYDHENMFRVSYPEIKFHPANDENKVFHGLTIIMIVKEPDTEISVYSTKREFKTSMFNIYRNLRINTERLER